MYARRPVLFLIGIVSTSGVLSASEPCPTHYYPYAVEKQKTLKLPEPDRDSSLVALTTASSFIVYAEQTELLSAIVALKQERPPLERNPDLNGLEKWIRDRKPASTIFVDELDEGGNSRASFMLMLFAEEAKIYVSSPSAGRFLNEVTLEWYSCSGESGGRRIRTKDSVTVFWTLDYIA